MSLLLVPAYAPLRKTALTTWPAGASQQLQDCFDRTNWVVFEDSDLGGFTDSVLCYIKNCIDTVDKRIWIYPNQKPWMNKGVQQLLKKRNNAFKSGDTAIYSTARANLKRGIREAILMYMSKNRGPPGQSQQQAVPLKRCDDPGSGDDRHGIRPGKVFVMLSRKCVGLGVFGPRASELKEEQMKSQQRIQEKQKKALASGRQSPSLIRPDFQTSSISVPQHLSFDGVRNSLSDLKKRLEKFCEEEFNKIPPHAAAVQIFSPPEPQSREEFLKYFCYLTLDPNTTHRNLILSEKNRVMRYSEREQQYSDHPERFDYNRQVLCKESVCGRCYWEVEWSGVVYISVSYKDISRKGQGDECGFGFNNQSWSLRCRSSSLSFYHNNIKTDLRAPSSSRIGVYVDHSAGTLSFYSVSDTMKLLHRVHTTFTQPLYAGFRPYWCSDSTVRLCDPE
ncbi:E3 ubiquitin/ISG15 ligase TRIM25-like [Clarias gariepinus]